jgi:hypothetical protein
MRLIAWFMLCALAACGGAPDTSPQGVCARTAEDDAQVKQLVMLSATNTSLEMELRPQLRDARKQAADRCLGTMGIESRGGVQRQTPALPR